MERRQGKDTLHLYQNMQYKNDQSTNLKYIYTQSVVYTFRIGDIKCKDTHTNMKQYQAINMGGILCIYYYSYLYQHHPYYRAI